jgi:anti-sigma factor RsiW
MALKPLQENGVTRSSGGCLDAELLASYVDGRTTPEQRVEVEAHLARCEDCYFAFSETVQEQGAEGVESEESEPPSRWRGWVPRTAAGLAAAAAVVIAVQMFGPFAATRGPDGDLDRLTSRIRELESQLAQERDRPANTAGRLALSQPFRALQTTLTPGMVRDGGMLAQVVISPNDATVRFRLLLTGSEFPAYRAVFVDADGEEVMAVSKLRVDPGSPTRAVTTVVPSDLLSPGEYQIKVSGTLPDGTNESVATYSLRVTAR